MHVRKFPLFSFYTIISLWVILFVNFFSCDCAPGPKNYIFEGDEGFTTESTLDEVVTATDNDLALSENDELMAQPSEADIITSASSTNSNTATALNSIDVGGDKKNLASNLLLLQQLQQELQRQQQLKQQQQLPQPQPQAQQFSLDGVIKSVMKMLHVAKLKIDAGARTFRDILLLFDRKKHVNIQPSK